MKTSFLFWVPALFVAACQDSGTPPEVSTPTSVEARLEYSAAETPTQMSVIRVLGQVVVPSSASWVVGPSVEARLVEWSVTTGSRVEVGQTLATLVSPELGDLASVENELRRVASEREKNVGRLKESVEAGFTSSGALHEAELSVSEVRAQLQRVQQQLGVRNANIRKGQKSQWEWVSPVDGIVTAIECAPGGLYSAESRCITIVATDAPRLRVDVSESVVHKIGDHVPTARWTPAGATSPLTLTLDRRDAGYDAQSRTQSFFFKADGLTVGASGPVEFDIPAPKDAVLVPRMAVVEVQGEDTVFVDKGEARPVAVPVTVVGRHDLNTLITGIAAGDKVVARGAFALKSVLAFE
jgi:cobalt-zinc-cadmium efflux system membrane fusion protein